MRYFALLSITPFVSALFYLTLPSTSDANPAQGTGNTIAQVIVAVLVGGLFAFNHYKGTIKTFYKNLVSRGEKREGPDD